ncbi:MAG: TIGR03619 family F420-dependent LLM class oxidoreductase [Rhodobacteraceae bacterium]|nr:TIGR03619 family F420-dependent LLM class oxidoreductase [Paracoccaceae bacterium]
MRRLQVGLHIDGDLWEAGQITAVENHGFDLLTTGEHMVFFRPILDTITVLAYAAAVTRRIRLVPSTLILPLRHPTVLAKELTSIDLLSRGRLIASVGIGGDYPREFQACGVNINERGARANEGIEIMRRYWSGERFSYAGRHFQLEDVDMLPLPWQPGGPPLWICGRSDPAMRRAARYGDGWQPYMYTADLLAESVDKVRGFAAEIGRDLPADFAFTTFMYVAMHDDVAEARNRAIEQLSYRFNMPFEKIVDKYCAYGPAERIVEALRTYVEAGTNHLIIGLVMPEAGRMDHVARFATEILPALQAMGVR